MQLGSLQIYDQLEPRRLHERQIRGFGTIEDATGIDTGLEPHTSSRVADQTTDRDKIGPFVHNRDLIARFQSHELIAAYLEKQIGAHEECNGGPLGQGLKSEVDFVSGAGL